MIERAGMFQKELVFGIIGGLGLFIFGIKIMSDGLKKVAGERMRRILSYLTAHRFKGLVLGGKGLLFIFFQLIGNVSLGVC